MSRSVKIYRGLVAKVTPLKPVREVLKKEADQVDARAEQIAAAEDYEVNTTVVEGVHPGSGRAYARVISYDADQEFGTWAVKRRRILGRAADVRME